VAICHPWVRVNGKLQVLGNGHHESMVGILGQPWREIPSLRGKRLWFLFKMSIEFDFTTVAKSRLREVYSLHCGLESLIGRRLHRDIAEADKSQSGKTYRQK